jgi:hypothetical protein
VKDRFINILQNKLEVNGFTVDAEKQENFEKTVI